MLCISLLIINLLILLFDAEGDELAAFGTVVDQMLQDVQERLVYRAQVMLLTGNALELSLQNS